MCARACVRKLLVREKETEEGGKDRREKTEGQRRRVVDISENGR